MAKCGHSQKGGREMDALTRLCAYVLCFGSIIYIAYLVVWLWDKLDRYDKKKYRRIIESRRQAFARDCERVGKALFNRDEIHKTVNMPTKKKPIRKAVGYFSDDLAQLLIQ